MNIPFSPPYIDESVENEVLDALRSGWITSGPKVKALEDEIKQYTGAQQVLCVNSWTSGAILMLKWLGVTPGDEVIVPAYTYSATAMAVLHAGAKPIMVDVNEDFNISINNIKKAISTKTKAIIPVDFSGYPCDYDALMKLVNETEIKTMFHATLETQKQLGRIAIISDAAHSFGAWYKGKRTGSVADITIFSLHAVKNLTTAEGGAICLNLPSPFDNEALYKELKIRSLNSQTKDALAKSKAGGWRYDITGLGMKINMADVNAAIGLAQIRQYDVLLAKRKEIFSFYNLAFSQYELAILPPGITQEKESSYHLYPLRIKNFTEDKRDRLIDLITQKGVAVNVHFIPMPMLTLFKNLGYMIDDYPCAYHNYEQEISLPIYPQMTNEQISYVVDVLVDSYKVINE